MDRNTGTLRSVNRVTSIVVIGNPGNRRIDFFTKAAHQHGLQTDVISWTDVLRDVSILKRFALEGRVVRIDSPGEDTTVERQLIARGAATNREAYTFSGERGRIEHSRLWYSGFADTLKAVRDVIPQATWLNHPDDITQMFDKTACQTLLHQQGIPVPELLGTAQSYDEIRDLMHAAGTSRVFVKLPHASSASGVVALQVNRGQVIAQTSTQIVRQGRRVLLYNSLNVSRYTTTTDVADLLNELGKDRLHVERWVPKAGFQGRIFDLRVVTIGGVACHTVVRTSRNPLTNLHLGNARGPLDELRDQIPLDQWNAAMHSCEQAALCFPRSLYTGIDLLFTPGFRSHAVIELNAFGDLLPNVLHKGRDTYNAEIVAMLTKLTAPS